MIDKLQSYLDAMGFENQISNEFEKNAPSFPVTVRDCSLLIFDFGFDTESQSHPFDQKQLKQVMKAFLKIVSHQKKSLLKAKWIGINITQTCFETIFKSHLSTYRNNFVTGISFGTLPSRGQKEKWQWGFSLSKENTLELVKYLIIRYAACYFDLMRKVFKKIKSWL